MTREKRKKLEIDQAVKITRERRRQLQIDQLPIALLFISGVCFGIAFNIGLILVLNLFF